MGNTVAVRASNGALYVFGAGSYYKQTQSAAINMGDFLAWCGEPVVLIDSTTSGAIPATDYNRLNKSPGVTLSLDNDIYHLQTKTDTTFIYRNLGASSIKTITVNSDYSWANTETEIQI